MDQEISVVGETNGVLPSCTTCSREVSFLSIIQYYLLECCQIHVYSAPFYKNSLKPKISFCRHVGISSESVKCFVDQLDPLLQCPVNNDSDDVCGTGEEQHNDVIQKYDELCKLLRNLKDLPLSINSIQGSAPVFRYSEVSVQGHL